MNRQGLAVMLLGAVLATSGCVPLLIGAARGRRSGLGEGSLEQNFDKSVDQLHRASLGD